MKSLNLKSSLVIAILLYSLLKLDGQTQPGLHVEENHTVLFGSDTLDSGSKFFWRPSKSAIRAGKVNGEKWDGENVGPFSAAFGKDTEARGNNSNAFGEGNWAYSYGETSVGTFSLGGGDPDDWVLTDPIFEVGNGMSSGSRSNAMTVFKNGNTEFSNSIQIGVHSGTSPEEGTLRWNDTEKTFEGFVQDEWCGIQTTKTKVKYISSHEFSYNVIDESTFHNEILNPSGAYIIDDGNYSQQNYLYVPLSFEVGTWIDTLILKIYDNDPNKNLSVRISSQSLTGAGVGFGNVITSSGASATHQIVTYTNPIYLHPNLAKFLVASVQTNTGNISSWGNGDIKLSLVKVIYREP